MRRQRLHSSHATHVVMAAGARPGTTAMACLLLSNDYRLMTLPCLFIAHDFMQQTSKSCQNFCTWYPVRVAGSHFASQT